MTLTEAIESKSKNTKANIALAWKLLCTPEVISGLSYQQLEIIIAIYRDDEFYFETNFIQPGAVVRGISRSFGVKS